MIRSFQRIKNILILAPHPDDEALGCSGTIAIMNRKGAATTIVFITDGERLNGAPSQDIAEKRREEGRRVSRMLGCNEPIFLGFPDGEVSRHGSEISGRLSEIITMVGPDIILAPSLIDYHQDHIAASGIALRLFTDQFICNKTSTSPLSSPSRGEDASKNTPYLAGGDEVEDELLSNTTGFFKLAFYEVYSTIKFNCLMDISEVLEQKKNAILAYNTSLYGKPEVYVHASLGLNAHRSIFVQKASHYEAFHVQEKADSEEHLFSYLCCMG